MNTVSRCDSTVCHSIGLASKPLGLTEELDHLIEANLVLKGKNVCL